MGNEIEKSAEGHVSPFERIKRTNDAEIEYWESRDLSEILDYTQYRNFEAVIEKAKLACFNSGHQIEDHFADVSKMIEIGKGGMREVKVTLLSRYACYLIIQNADPKKEIVAHGQTYFAIQTRRQELEDERIEDERRMLLREEMRRLINFKSHIADFGCRICRRESRQAAGATLESAEADFVLLQPWVSTHGIRRMGRIGPIGRWGGFQISDFRLQICRKPDASRLPALRQAQDRRGFQPLMPLSLIPSTK